MFLYQENVNGVGSPRLGKGGPGVSAYRLESSRRPQALASLSVCRHRRTASMGRSSLARGALPRPLAWARRLMLRLLPLLVTTKSVAATPQQFNNIRTR